MARFFFHLRQSNGRSVDDVIGMELPDEKAALVAGEWSANRLEGETQRKGDVLGFARVEVTDEGGRLVDVVPLVAAAGA